MTPIADVFPKLGTPKDKLDLCLITPVSENSLKSNMVIGPRDWRNMHDSTFTIFIDHWEGNLPEKSLSYDM